MNSDDVVIRLADLEDIGSIHEVALATWEPTYRAIITQEQIAMMFSDLLSVEAIGRQIANAEGTYVVAFVDGQPHGFAFFRKSDDEAGVFKLHRLYVRPGTQGSGIGRSLLHDVERRVAEQGGRELRLNVNRFNSAQDFYRKQGYQVIQSVDIPYRQFWLNDYVMKKALS
jgi:ribosomal protein S18 acetylase RimI-like enzyme